MRFGGWRSEIFEVSSGLPQGSPLSSVLFNVYTADLIEATQVQECSPYSYVDDLIITSLGSTPVEAVAGLQLASNRLEQWTVENKMSAQPDKGCWMLASRGYFDPGVYRLTF